MMNFNSNAPIFQNQPAQVPNHNIPNNNVLNGNNQSSGDPFDKLLNRKLNGNNTTSSEKKLEDYRKQIEQLDLEQLKMERKRLVDLIVKYMNEGKKDLLEEHQKKYKIAMEVSDSKVMNFSASSIAQKNTESSLVAQANKEEDMLKKLQESDILPPDNSQPPIIPPQTQVSQMNQVNNNTNTQVFSIGGSTNPMNPNVTNVGFGQNVTNVGFGQSPNQNNFSIINTLNSVNTNQLNSLFSQPQGIFNSLNSLQLNPQNNFNLQFPNLSLGNLPNMDFSSNPYSPLMTMYGVYAPNLRTDPRMNAFLNGQLYPQDMADLGVWSSINNELFKTNRSED